MAIRRKIRKTRKAKTVHRRLVEFNRRLFWFSARRQEALKAALVGYNGNGDPMYKCANCGGKHEEVAVDHTEPVGKQPTSWEEWSAYLVRMHEGPLQVLCKREHQEKTNRERAERKKK